MATDDWATRQLDAIATATERATELTRRLLTFSTRQVAQTATADLNDAVLETREIMAPSRSVDPALTALEIDLSPVRLDPGQLSQVLVNLVLNARDAMPKGGRDRDRHSPRRTWRRPDDREGLRRCSTVTDTGEGMDEATRARIFEPFFTTKGTGSRHRARPGHRLRDRREHRRLHRSRVDPRRGLDVPPFAPDRGGSRSAVPPG